MTDAECYEIVRECSERINAGYRRIAEVRAEHPEWFPLFESGLAESEQAS